MDPAVAGLISAIGGGVLLYVISPMINRRLEAARSNDPALGWKTAVEEVRTQAKELAARVTTLEAEVERLEDDNNLKTATIARQEETIRQQSNMLVARDSRIAQLESVFHSASLSLPPADPSVAYWLTFTPSGGIKT